MWGRECRGGSVGEGVWGRECEGGSVREECGGGSVGEGEVWLVVCGQC